MKKILLQNLGHNETEAKALVKYTWEKDEIAYYFCKNYRAIFKVQFTGERWFLLGRWSEYSEKIYQFKYLECSLETKDTEYMGLNNDGIAHRAEEIFYSTKEEAIEEGIEIIKKVAMDAINLFERDMQRIDKYKNKTEQETF